MNETGFWLVWSPSGQKPPKYRHSTWASAVIEAQRLASLHPGERFYVLRAIEYLEQPPVQRVELQEDPLCDEIPF